MKTYIKFILGLLLCIFSGGILYSFYVSTSLTELISNIRPLFIFLFQVGMFCFGLLTMFWQRTVSFWVIIFLLLIEMCFIGFVAQSIAQNINDIVAK